MNKIQKVILIIILILIIIVMVLAGILLKNMKEEKDLENIYSHIDEIEVETEIKLVENHNQYYSVLNTITGYYMNIGKKEKKATYDILEKEYITANNITIDNVLEKLQVVKAEEPTYIVQKMYKQDSYKVAAYYVYGKLQEDMFENEYKETYLIIYVDNYNNTYSIEPIEKTTYEEVIKKGKQFENKEISKNDNNKYKSIIVNDETITTQLLYNYKSLTQNNIEEAFNKLDKNYKSKKFNNNIEEYKKYLTKSNVKYVMLSQYQKKLADKYTQYICVDQNGKYYIFRETSAMEYTVILDTYTIDLPEFTQKYNASSDEDKLLLNVQKFFAAIDDGDYRYAYNKLDNTYKNTNFKTQLDFENYVKKNFFAKNSLTTGKMEKQGDVYLYTVSISDGTGKTSNSITKKFVIQLKEGTDFVMSFNLK